MRSTPVLLGIPALPDQRPGGDTLRMGLANHKIGGREGHAPPQSLPHPPRTSDRRRQRLRGNWIRNIHHRQTRRQADPSRPQMRRERFGKLGGIRQWVEPVFDHETTISLSKSTANERPPESIQGSPPDSSPAPPASGTTGLSKAPNHLDSIIQAVNLTFTAFPYRRHDRFHLSGNGNHWEAYPTGPCGFDTRQGDFPRHSCGGSLADVGTVWTTLGRLAECSGKSGALRSVARPLSSVSCA